VKSRIVRVNDRMQMNYRYELIEAAGRNVDPDFNPELTPKQMLALGIFCGKYMTDCTDEFPKSWFVRAKLSPAPSLTIHREGRTAELLLVGSRHELDPRSVKRVCEALGLKWSDLPGPKSRA
jgi:hypothetical protein